MNNCTILYVDDEDPNLLSFKFLFGKKFTIETTSSPLDAIEIVKSGRIQIVVSDQRMPGMSGLDMFKEISQINPDIVKILLTADAKLDTVMEAINGGELYRYITKPFEKDDVLNALENAIEVYNLRIQNKQLLQNLIETNNHLNLFNEELEKKVQERTNHLQIVLDEMEKLKLQQDGDYYLTSLLIEPLSRNTVQSDRVKIECLLEQKKEFLFKGETRSIGGDINIAHKLTLLDKSYIVFINADAMGKSTQGAGGALVFGTAFEVIMERARSFKWGKNLMPDEWIYNTYLELNRTFTFFEGLMMVSMCIGIIEEESGKLYFIIAEHPLPVLYREGKAKFISEQQHYFKLGFPVIEGIKKKISIGFHQLQVGDSLFFGSDGRDDVLLPSEDGIWQMNEDETRFLKCVEKSNGDLFKLSEEIRKNARVIDDLSLLKTTYLG